MITAKTLQEITQEVENNSVTLVAKWSPPPPSLYAHLPTMIQKIAATREYFSAQKAALHQWLDSWPTEINDISGSGLLVVTAKRSVWAAMIELKDAPIHDPGVVLAPNRVAASVSPWGPCPQTPAGGAGGASPPDPPNHFYSLISLVES